MTELPILDVGPFLAGVPGSRETLAVQLGEACEKVGFYFIVNHGVPQWLIDRTFDEARRFHSLPLKQRLTLKKGPDYVGFVPSGGVRADTGDGFDNSRNKPDVHESFHINRDFAPDHPAVLAHRRFHVPQPWPAGLPGFKENVQEYFFTLEALGRRLLPVYATALGAPPEYFDDYFVDALAWLRLVHYPAVEHVEANQFGLGAHTDAGFLTFLPQTDVPGLQILTADDRWIAQPIVPGSYLVNAGQTLKRWSNNRFRATPHRVISPPPGVDRYSIPLFFNPGAHALVRCIDSCTSPENPPQYEPTRYDEHLDWYIANTYRSTVSA